MALALLLAIPRKFAFSSVCTLWRLFMNLMRINTPNPVIQVGHTRIRQCLIRQHTPIRPQMRTARIHSHAAVAIRASDAGRKCARRKNYNLVYLRTYSNSRLSENSTTLSTGETHRALQVKQLRIRRRNSTGNAAKDLAAIQSQWSK